MYVYLCTKPGNENKSGQDIMSYKYIIFNQEHDILVNDRIELPPYVKHSYPSYKDTDNKTKFRTLLKKHPFVKNVKSATNDEGGDAYTVIQLDY
jgi:hypothetical protein